MKNLKDFNSKDYIDLYEWLIIVAGVCNIISGIWKNEITYAIAILSAAVLLITFIIALFKGWSESRSLKKVYEDNKVWLVGIALGIVMILALAALKVV